MTDYKAALQSFQSSREFFVGIDSGRPFRSLNLNFTVEKVADHHSLLP